MRLPQVCGLLAAFLLASGIASATTIGYSATHLAGSAWRYDYTLTNNTPGALPLREFTIYFALGEFTNLAVTSSPPGWDSLVAQPDAGLPADGYFDALALEGGIPPAAGLGGFAVTFDYLGGGTPGPQAFEVIDPVSFVTLSSGTTAVVPAPGGAWLLGTAMAGVAARVRRRSRRPRSG